MINHSRIRVCLLFILFLSFSVPAIAEEDYEEALTMELEELMETKVSISSLRPKPLYKSPGTVSVITSKDISNMPARQLTDILKTVPGFDVRYNNFGEYFVSSGGVDNPSNILMMINGHRYNDFYTGGAIYDIPVDNFEKVEIMVFAGNYTLNLKFIISPSFTSYSLPSSLKSPLFLPSDREPHFIRSS